MALVGSISGSGGAASTIGISGSVIFGKVDDPSLFPKFGDPGVGSDVIFFVSGNISSKPSTSPNTAVRGTTVFGGDVVISGTLFGGSPLYIGSPVIFGAEGLSGSLTKLADGTSYLIAGTNVTITTGSNGAVTISSTATGGGGGGGDAYFSSTTNGSIFTTGSAAFRGAESLDSPADKGTDVFFFVSGSANPVSNPAVALFSGNVVSSGSLTLKDSISGSPVVELGNNGVISGSGNFRVGGDVVVAGNIDTDLDEPKTLFASAGSSNITIGAAGSTVIAAGTLRVDGNITADTNEPKQIFVAVTSNNIEIGGAGSTVVVDALTVGGGFGGSGVTISSAGGISADGNVVIGGDLTVNGTTTTLNTANLLVEDPVIYFGSGSIISNQPGGIALASGSSVTHQALVWGRVAQDTWGAGSLDVQNGTVTDFTTVTNYLPVRASKFEVGGANAYVSSSDAASVLVNFTDSLKLSKSGNQRIRIAEYSGVEGAIIGTNASDVLNGLWLSGSSINVDHGASDYQGLTFARQSATGGRISVSGAPGNTSLNIIGGLPSGAGSVVLSGSTVAINARTSTSATGVVIQGGTGASTLARFHGNSSNVNIDFGGSTNTTLSAPISTSPTAELSLTGSVINLGHGAEVDKPVNFLRGLSAYGAVKFVQESPNSYAQFGSQNIANAVRIGSAGKVNLSGSIVEVSAGGGAVFTTTTSAATNYLTIASGSFPLAGTSVASVSKIESTLNSANLLLGAPGAVFLTGSQARISVGGTNTAALQRDGRSFITFSSGSTSENETTVSTVLSTRVDLFNTVATTVNFAGAATALEIGASTGTTSVNNNLAVDGNTTLGNEVTDTITFTARAASNLEPTTDSAYDLGSVGRRWKNIYTGDLHLRNDRGNWTIIEEREFLSITNNITGKRYKFVLQEIE